MSGHDKTIEGQQPPATAMPVGADRAVEIPPELRILENAGSTAKHLDFEAAVHTIGTTMLGDANITTGTLRLDQLSPSIRKQFEKNNWC